MNRRNDITGVVLAGGKSSRMGADKGVLKVNGKSMAEHAVRALQQVTEQVMIIANNENYGGLGVPVYKDLIPDCGPMGGIYTALKKAKTERILVVSCDIPRINPLFLQEMLNQDDDAEVVIPAHDGKKEPLCAVYSINCEARFAELISGKRFKLKDALSLFRVKELQVDRKKWNPEKMFQNVNTPQDLQAIKKTEL